MLLDTKLQPIPFITYRLLGFGLALLKKKQRPFSYDLLERWAGSNTNRMHCKLIQKYVFAF